MPPSGRRNSTLPLLPGRRRAVPGQHRQRVAQQGQGGVRGRRQRQAGRRAHRPLERIADHRRRLGVAPALDTLRSASTSAAAACAAPRPAPRSRNEARRRTAMWFSFSRASRRNAKARRRSALPGNIDRKARADVLQLHRRLARSLPARSRRATGCGRGRASAASSTNGRGSSGPMFMSTGAIGVVTEIHTLAALRHRVRIENLIADRRPEQVLRLRLLDVRPPGSAAITRSPGRHGRPVGTGHLAIHR